MFENQGVFKLGNVVSDTVVFEDGVCVVVSYYKGKFVFVF